MATLFREVRKLREENERLLADVERLAEMVSRLTESVVSETTARQRAEVERLERELALVKEVRDAALGKVAAYCDGSRDELLAEVERLKDLVAVQESEIEHLNGAIDRDAMKDRAQLERWRPVVAVAERLFDLASDEEEYDLGDLWDEVLEYRARNEDADSEERDSE